MVQRIIGFLYKEAKTLNQAALLLGLFAFFSQILAFLRDRLLAHIFGASAELDVYYAAFRIPDFIFVAVASVVSLSVLVPFIIEKEREGRESLREFIDTIFSFFAVLMVFVSVLAFFLMPWLSSLLFKGVSPEMLQEIILLSRVMLLSPIILGLSNLFGSITQAYNRFTVYALSPLLYNAGIIFGTIFLTKKLGVLGVAIGVIVGAFFHMLIQIPFVLKSGLFPRISPNLNWEVVRKVVVISFPRTLTLAMGQIALIFLVSLASLMSVGSISVLSLATHLQSVPMALVGVSYSLAAFPTLSRRFQEKNLPDFVLQMATTARFVIFWTLPMTALFIVLRAQIVRVILGSGQFSWEDTRLVAAALALFVLSATFQCLQMLFMRGFYSAGFTKKPFYINLFATLVLIFSSYALVQFFYLSETFRYFISALLKVEDLRETVVLMLPLGFSIGMIINGILHWVAFEREFKGFSEDLHRTLFQVFGASVIMGAAAYIGLNVFALFFSTTSLLGILLQGLFSGAVASIAGIVVLLSMNNRELRDVWSVLKGRFWKTRVIATDPEIV